VTILLRSCPAARPFEVMLPTWAIMSPVTGLERLFTDARRVNCMVGPFMASSSLRLGIAHPSPRHLEAAKPRPYCLITRRRGRDSG